MSLAEEFLVGFDRGVRARGKQYFRQGRVKIIDSSPGHIAAIVQGTDEYRVDLEWDESGSYRSECSCPYAEENGVCKHTWAVLLEAKDQSLLPQAVQIGSLDDDSQVPEIPREFANLVEEDDDAEANDAEDDEPVRPSPTTQPNLPRWKRQLARLREQMKQAAPPPLDEARIGSWPANKRIAYVVQTQKAGYSSSLVSITISTQALVRANEWGSPKEARITRSAIAQIPDEKDRLIIQLLAGSGRTERYYYGDGQINAHYPLGPQDYELILKRICETGKCFIRGDDGEHGAMRSLAWDTGAAWEFWLQLEHDEGGERYSLGGSFRRGEERINCRDVRIVLDDGLLIARGMVGRADLGAAHAMLTFLREAEAPISLAVQQGEEMLAELLTMSPLPKLDLPPSLQIQSVAPPMRPRLNIRAPKRTGYDDKLVGELSFEYQGKIIVEGENPSLFDPASRSLLRRDTAAELAAAAKLDLLKFRNGWGYEFSSQRRRLSPSRLNKVVLQLCLEGWQVEAEGTLYRQAGEFQLQVSSGIDWFELDGTLDFGGVAARLPKLLAALRSGEKTIQLDDGTVGILPEDWLRKYGLLAQVSRTDGDQIKFSRGQAGLLDALMSTLPHATCDAVFEQARQELRRFDGVAPIDAPEGFVGQLRPYQREGLGWLQFLTRFGFGGCLADDMGLGKTIQVLAMLESRREKKKPSLVVVPRSLVFNWIEEAKRFTPEMKILDHSGINRAKTAAQFGQYDLILTTYGTLRLDAMMLKDFNFDYAILDEAQAIKNGSSASAKAARLIQASHRLALSGTPIQNHLGELWSLFEFLNPGMLGSASFFKNTGAGSQQVERESRELLSRALRPFILRRTKEQVATDLPAKTEQTIWCELEPAQRKQYDELRDHYRASLLGRIATDGLNKSKIQVLEALLRLRQAACHPGLIDKTRVDETSAKIDALLPQLAEVIEEGHKVLVFSQFTSMLAIVKRHLDKQKITYEYLDGKTRDRQAKVERFQNDPDCKLFLISLKAGGLGLNLTAAEYVFLLDPWWNPAVESQAIDRAHRIGQTRHVFAYRIISKDTVEQKVLELQAKKKDLADMILNADSSLIGQLKREDLEMLLS